jgi:nicotinate-nucleotide pyrophosphorylase (carboxylating)
MPSVDPPTVAADAERALREDLGHGDRSAAALPAEGAARAAIVAREGGVACGRPWVEAVFAQVDARVAIAWPVEEGQRVAADTILCELTGPARALCAGERTALNFLGLLCGVATATRTHVDAVAGTGAAVLDTRKTLPGLRAAQKYAVVCGGGRNHRMGLYDAAMLKENHIHAAGGIAAAVRAVRVSQPTTPLTVEIESLDQIEPALTAGADRLLLDNFGIADLRRAVAINAGRAHLEASGGMEATELAAIAATGVDTVSVGALTKHVRALDLSMGFRANR